ncbi:hypothetical protein Aduo_009016 [Ancylostoma duodenale]
MEKRRIEGRKLMQQFVVDTWMKIEQNHLKSIRQNQALLRVDTYRGLQAFMVADESDGGPPGRNIVLPASYSGSPRDIGAKYQDALSIVARYGKPDLFINVTCNPHAARTSRKNSRSMHQWRAMDIQGIEEKTVGVLSCVEEEFKAVLPPLNSGALRMERRNEKWQERRQRSLAVGRMYYVGPKDFERFALRSLLFHQKGATSFVDLRSVNNRAYDPPKRFTCHMSCEAFCEPYLLLRSSQSAQAVGLFQA